MGGAFTRKRPKEARAADDNANDVDASKPKVDPKEKELDTGAAEEAESGASRGRQFCEWGMDRIRHPVPVRWSSEAEAKRGAARGNSVGEGRTGFCILGRFGGQAKRRRGK